MILFDPTGENVKRAAKIRFYLHEFGKVYIGIYVKTITRGLLYYWKYKADIDQLYSLHQIPLADITEFTYV